MKTTRILMAATAAVLLAVPAFAADSTTSKTTTTATTDNTVAPAAGTTTTTTKTDTSKPARGIFKADTDGDGKVSKAEWDAYFDSLDTDKDGYLTKSEVYGNKNARHHGKIVNTTETSTKGSTSTPPDNNEVASKPGPKTPAGADGAGGSTAQ